MQVTMLVAVVAVSLISLAHAACRILPDPMPAAPKDIPSGDILRRQIATSLKLSSVTVPDSAWNCSDWSAFAKAADPLQDFAFGYMACGDASSSRRFVHFDYGLGDNDFGTVHEVSEEQPLCRVNDGDWSGDGRFCRSLEKAAGDDATINDRWAILDLHKIHVAEAKTIDRQKADNYGADLYRYSFGVYVHFWDTDGSEFLRLTSASNRTCIVYVDGFAAGGRSPYVQIQKDGTQPQLRCRAEQTQEWQQQSLMEKYPGAWCTRWRLVVEDELEEEFHVMV